MLFAVGFVWFLQLWLSVGLIVAVAFVARGVTRIDETARDSGIGFRLLLIPASAVLWPWLLWRWYRSQAASVECTYHRCAVELPDADEER